MNRIYRIARRLLVGAPDGDSQGEVEVRMFRDAAGRASFTINQYSHDGGWSSPETYSLAAANLAAEILCLQIGATLLACEECDAEDAS